MDLLIWTTFKNQKQVAASKSDLRSFATIKKNMEPRLDSE